MEAKTKWKSADMEHERMCESYQFDYVGIKRRASDGKLFWSTDSGCSCPVPWESHTEADWNPLPETFAEFEKAVRSGKQDGSQFVEDVRSMLKAREN